jgi:hypothetical protein
MGLTVTDTNGLTESCQATITIVDDTPPTAIITVPQLGDAFQDGVTFVATAEDNCEVDEVYFYLREPSGADGTPIGYDNLPATYNTKSENWEYNFDTTNLQDSYYVLMIKVVDGSGNESGVLLYRLASATGLFLNFCSFKK